MSKQRKHLSAEEKVSILRRHFIEKIPISLVCEQAGIQPSQFYQWQKQFFENGAAAFQSSSRTRHDRSQDRIAALQAKLRKKDEVLGELMEEHVALKKSLGEL